MKIEHVYRPTAELCAPTDSLHDAARRMIEADTGSLAVLVGGAVVAVISERDVVRAASDGVDSRRTTVRSYAAPAVFTTADEDTTTVALRMLRAGIRELPVIGPTGELVGMVSMRDLFAVHRVA